MPIDFPSGPTIGQVYSYQGKSWVYNGSAWDSLTPTFLSPPPGVISQFAGSAAPDGYLLCVGQSLNTTTFANLFNAIGYTYGGSGSSFTIPNLQGRVTVGRDATQGEFDVLGESGGAKTHTLTTAEMPSHTHTQNSHNHGQDAHNHSQNPHSHPIFGNGWFYLANGSGNADANITTGGGGYSQIFPTNATATNNAATATNQPTIATNQNTGGGGAHNNLQPYIVLNYIIKT